MRRRNAIVRVTDIHSGLWDYCGHGAHQDISFREAALNQNGVESSRRAMRIGILRFTAPMMTRMGVRPKAWRECHCKI
jgi:hypothetical protein